MNHRMKMRAAGHNLLPYLLIVSVAGAAVLIAVAAVLKGWMGAGSGLFGLLAGAAVSQLLFRDLRKAIEDDLSKVLVRYWRSLLIRWGLVAVFVFLITRYFSQGLLFAVIGFVLGLLASILMVILQTTYKEKGGEK